MAIRALTKVTKRRKKKEMNVVGVIILSFSIIVAAFILSKRTPATPAKATVQTAIVAEYDMVNIPVPAHPVRSGVKMEDIRFKHVPFPAHQVPKNALSSIEDLSGMFTTAASPANLPIFAQNFSVKKVGNRVIQQIPPGMRAMTVRVDATSAVEGWASIGAIVDVLLAEQDRTTVVAEQVKIISAERQTAPQNGEDTPSIPSTVTLLVSQEQCLAINTALPLGRIAFALRGISDEDSWTQAHYTARRLKRGTQTIAKGAGVTGYVEVKGENKGSSFALADGKWIRTDVIPEGFLVGDRNDAQSEPGALGRAQYAPETTKN